MRSYSTQLRVLLQRLLILLLLFQLTRLAFLIRNFSYFNNASFTEILLAFIYGIRFDLDAIITLNALFVLLHIIPLKAFYNKGYQVFLKIIFYLFNIPALAINCVDIEYFRYQGKRTTADFFNLFAMGDDMKNTIPQMVRDFWYVLIILIACILIAIWLYQKIKLPPSASPSNYRFTAWLYMLPLAGIAVIAARGGFQYKPLGIMSAAQDNPVQLVPLVLNSPFTVIRSFGKEVVEETNYMSQTEAIKYFNKDHNYSSSTPFKPLNVVVIIMESFSSEYIGAFNNGRGYTPVLDSLMKYSLVFDNAFANAKKSIDGIPAVTASMPALMPASYITSPYNGNTLLSLAGILKKKGYASAFFHGGNNGTMGFDNFTLMTGYDKYYGRKEYPGNEYDGQWGIFDEPYFSYFCDQVTKMQKPCITTIFSLSSHHPYAIPTQLTNKFPKGTLPIHESIGYSDYALGKFFQKASKTDWYANTLFVITADHTGPSGSEIYQTKAGMFRVPVIYFYPGGNLVGMSDKVTQQTDILPSVLDFMHFDQPFTAFGNSVFDSSKTGMAVNYTGDVYQIFQNDQLIQFDGDKPVGYFNFKTDSLLEQNLLEKNNPDISSLNTLKSFIQQYNHALIKNKLQPGTE